MKLNERIARAIDPAGWAAADYCRDQEMPPERYERSSRKAASRVIHALGLDEVTVIISAPAPNGPYFAREVRVHHRREIRSLTSDERMAYLTGHVDAITFPKDDA